MSANNISLMSPDIQLLHNSLCNSSNK